MKRELLEFVETNLRSRLETLDRRLGDAERNPKDTEAIHDLRVAVRRFVQCLRTFADLFDRDHTQGIRRRLGKLMDRCAAARNCDIALELLEKVPGDRVKKELRRVRLEAERTLVAYLERWKQKQRHSGWMKDLKVHKPRAKRTPWSADRSVAENARNALPKLARELFRAGNAAAAPEATHHEMHQFRLLGKRFRYTLELFEPVYGPELEKRLASLKALQDHLGAINDCVTSLELVRDHPRAFEAITATLEGREAAFRAFWNAGLGLGVPPQQVSTDWQHWLARKQDDKETNGTLHPATRGSTTPPRRTSGQRPQADTKGKGGREGRRQLRSKDRPGAAPDSHQSSGASH